MRISKRAIPVVAFALGACVFVSTAFADMALGTGYDRLKEAAKRSATQMEQGLDNYTVESIVTLKDNDKVLMEGSYVHKFDMVKLATEEKSVTREADGTEWTNYSYQDQERSIWKSSEDDTYYVSEYPDSWYLKEGPFQSPFKEEGAAEIERIVDAVIGGLKDQVQVEEKTNGGVTYSGTLTEAQVPPVVNAVASFAIKQAINEERYSQQGKHFPEIKSDIFVKKVTGTADESEAGLLERATGEAVLSGKDANGETHDLTVSFAVTMTDVGTTSIEVPDLQGAKVETVGRSGFNDKYVGTYRNNIVVEKDGAFVKIGERTLEITSVDGDKVTGQYYETVKAEFEAEFGKPQAFDFEYKLDNTQSLSTFTYTSAEGEERNGHLSPSEFGKVYLELNIEILDDSSFRHDPNPGFNGEFNRVFEE